MTQKDWYAWHADYQVPGSVIAQRLPAVQQRIVAAFDTAAPGPIRVLSLCAGQGLDLLGVLSSHPRRGDVRARLVELDPRNASAARHTAQAAGLTGIEVVETDAALVDGYADVVPVDLLLLCGIFGNVPDADIHTTVAAAAQLCAPGATVVWTRHRRPPDLVPTLCGWFAAHDFDLVSVSDPTEPYGVGAHRFTGRTRPLVRGARLFTFRH